MEDPFGSTPIEGAGVRKKRSRGNLLNPLPAPPGSDAIAEQLERAASPELVVTDLNAVSLRQQLQQLLEHKGQQAQVVGQMGQNILAQQAELEERIQSLGDMDEDGDDIGHDTHAKLLELQEAMKGWDSDNQGIMRELGGSKVSCYYTTSTARLPH